MTTVVRDGFHNAFTDLQYWQNTYWVSYRKGSDHATADGAAILASSVDRQRFQEVGRIKLPGDVRDPKMVPMSEEQMAVIFPVWIGGHQKRHLQQYVAFTRDGVNFDAPIPLFPPNHWLWRVVKAQDRYYGARYRFPKIKSEGAYVTELVVSDDMINWRTVSRIGDDAMQLGETGMHFMPDGELWTVTRRNNDPGTAILAIASPPYTQWEIKDLGRRIASPVIMEHNGSLHVAGRRSRQMDGDIAPAHLGPGVGIWKLDRAGLTPILFMPASGDCAYPGFIKDPEGRICFTYYSQHAYTDGVLEPQYALEPQPEGKTGRVLVPADVYFAELILD
jgi:hypothetical protein